MSPTSRGPLMRGRSIGTHRNCPAITVAGPRQGIEDGAGESRPHSVRGCEAYLRYVDDFALFGDEAGQLWAWKRAMIHRLAALRLTIHETSAQVLPVKCGIPWLGFVVYPTHRRIKARKVRSATRCLHSSLESYYAGQISFAEFDARVQGWINHVRYADSWGLRKHMFKDLTVTSARLRAGEKQPQ